MSRTFLATYTLLLALAVGASAQVVDAGDGPEVSSVPVSWQIDFDFVDMRRVEVGGRAYWYMLYKATNRTGRTVRFHPTIDLVTDDLRVVPANKGVPIRVFERIRTRHAATHVDLTHPTRAIGDLRVGDGYARQSVAIWREDEVLAEQFRVFVQGLSGEARLIANPRYDAAKPSGDDNRENFTVRKTLEAAYALPGSRGAQRRALPQRIRTRWVMR